MCERRARMREHLSKRAWSHVMFIVYSFNWVFFIVSYGKTRYSQSRESHNRNPMHSMLCAWGIIMYSNIVLWFRIKLVLQCNVYIWLSMVTLIWGETIHGLKINKYTWDWIFHSKVYEWSQHYLYVSVHVLTIGSRLPYLGCHRSPGLSGTQTGYKRNYCESLLSWTASNSLMTDSPLTSQLSIPDWCSVLYKSHALGNDHTPTLCTHKTWCQC